MKADGGTSTFAGIYEYDRLNRLRYSKRAEWGGSGYLAVTDRLASEYSYDPNGNIKTLTRRNAQGNAIFDNFTYQYEANTNRLDELSDASIDRFTPSGTGAATDIPPGVRQYDYDSRGNIINDGGKTITWTPYGKVETVQKETGAGEVRFIYDAQGNRVLKEETGAGGVVSKRTWYMRDAAGQHLTTYEQSGGSGTPRTKEYLLYGSSRLGTAYADNANGGAPVSGALYRRVVGQKQYEVGDHLGNVRATVGDIKVRSGSTFAVRVESFTEYFPFGMVASTATIAGGVGGRFGFNGMEKDNEVKGEGNHVDFGARWYDTRVARWGSVDPLERKHPNTSPYVFVLNNPQIYRDPDGKDGTITIYNNVITISTTIYIYGPDATTQAAANIESGIIKYWGTQSNGNPWQYIDPSNQQVYTIKLDVTVHLYDGQQQADPLIIFDKYNPKSRNNYIKIDNKEAVSYVDGGDEGTWAIPTATASAANLPAANLPSWTAAHEWGHLLGLIDRYSKVPNSNGNRQTRAHSGWNGNMMADFNGMVDQRNIDGIVGDAVRMLNVAQSAAKSVNQQLSTSGSTPRRVPGVNEPFVFEVNP